jgi:hypothetical protein
MIGSAVVRATILLATVAWAWAEVLKIRRPRQVEPARRLWTAGVALALIHAGVAFDVAYEWSQDAALIDTARRTAAVTGIAWGGGIFVNYLFLALWLADALWWWVAPVAYHRRPVRLEQARLAIVLVMFANGAIVFAGNAARAVGVPAVAAVCIAWMLDAWKPSARA